MTERLVPVEVIADEIEKAGADVTVKSFIRGLLLGITLGREPGIFGDEDRLRQRVRSICETWAP